jgi:RimJ/RimL family protein N-acetyltransferase
VTIRAIRPDDRGALRTAFRELDKGTIHLRFFGPKKGLSDRAEVAFTVEEDYQGLGIASRILRHLAAIAGRMGISQFHAEVLPENTGMLAVFDRSGFPVRQKHSEGVVHVNLSLSGDLQ